MTEMQRLVKERITQSRKTLPGSEFLVSLELDKEKVGESECEVCLVCVAEALVEPNTEGCVNADNTIWTFLEAENSPALAASRSGGSHPRRRSVASR